MSTNASNINLNTNPNTNINTNNINNAIGLRNKYIFLLIIYFIITVLILVYKIPQYITHFLTSNKTEINTSITIWIIFLFFIVSCITICMIVLYNNTTKGVSSFANFDNNLLIKFLQVFLSIFFIAFILCIIGIFIKNFNNTSIGGQIINVLLIVCGLAIVYKLLSYTSLLKKPIVRIVIYSLLYIPCLLFGLIETIAHEVKITTKPIVILLFIEIVLITLYLVYPAISNKLYTYGGKQIIDKPLPLNMENSISSYQELNETYEHTYQYALSFWFYIDSASPSMNSNYLKFTNILKYGNNPSVQYNASTNTLSVTTSSDSESTVSIIDIKNNNKNKNNKNNKKNNNNNNNERIQEIKIINERNDNGRRIIYNNDNVLLQKWNNIILNYNGGTLDIFYNGKLVKSAIEVVPYIKYDTMIVGEQNGIIGGIANVMYYKQPLDIDKIRKLYNYMKNKNPPTLDKI